ncbi:MAG: hypothetical protein ABW189_00360 [Rickettsiales bacterium]
MTELSPYAKSLIALILVLAAIWALYALMKCAARAAGGLPSLMGKEAEGKPRVLERHALMPSQHVTVMEFDGYRYVVYSAGGHLLLLDKAPTHA